MFREHANAFKAGDYVRAEKFLNSLRFERGKLVVQTAEDAEGTGALRRSGGRDQGTGTTEATENTGR